MAIIKRSVGADAAAWVELDWLALCRRSGLVPVTIVVHAFALVCLTTQVILLDYVNYDYQIRAVGAMQDGVLSDPDVDDLLVPDRLGQLSDGLGRLADARASIQLISNAFDA